MAFEMEKTQPRGEPLPNFALPKNVFIGCTKNKISYEVYVLLIFDNFQHPVSLNGKNQLPKNKLISNFRQKCWNKPRKLNLGVSPWPNYKFGLTLKRFFGAPKSDDYC